VLLVFTVVSGEMADPSKHTSHREEDEGVKDNLEGGSAI
jgi:hypothetical protein